MASNDESNPTPQPAPLHPEEPYPSERYAWYVVLVLMICYVFSFVDRQILNLLAPHIIEDWGLSDKSMSYLMGWYFALFYTFFGIPIGRLADSKSRRGLIAIGLATWSLMTACCGLARTYWQMAVFRLGVGVGEATLSPSAYSLITDYFRPQRLALAISVYGGGIYLGSGLAYLLGGVVVRFAGRDNIEIPVFGEIYSWQLAFLLIGLPGLVFALALFTIKEPVRRGVAKGAKSVALSEVFAYVGSNWKTVVCHNVGFALLSFIAYGSTSWMSAFFARVHGWSVSETGIRYGTVIMIFGTAGIIFGGWLGDYLTSKGYKDGVMRAGLIAAIAHLPLGFAFPLMPNGWLALAVLCPSIFTVAMPFGVAPAAIQKMMPNRMRAQASAVYLFVVNLIGLGVGPTAVAFFTEDVFKDPNKIGLSLITVSTVAGIVAVVLLYFAMGQFRNSIDKLEAWTAAGNS